MAKSRRDADAEMMGAAEAGKRVRKPGQSNSSGRVHQEDEHEGNLKFEVLRARVSWQIAVSSGSMSRQLQACCLPCLLHAGESD